MFLARAVKIITNFLWNTKVPRYGAAGIFVFNLFEFFKILQLVKDKINKNFSHIFVVQKTIFFESSDAGKYLTYLSFLPMFMYIDTVTDAILKGLNKQLYALKINIADSFMRIMLIFMLVPRLGIEGYILIMYISEIINFAASYFKLKKMTNLKISLSYSIIYPIVCSIICVWILKLIPTNNVFAEILIFAAMYFLATTAVKRK